MKKIFSYNILIGLGVLLFTSSCGGGSGADKKEEMKDVVASVFHTRCRLKNGMVKNLVKSGSAF